MSDESLTRLHYARRHLRFGWWSLLCFAILGFVLESLHAFKVRAYLDVFNETRRLMWTLAHAHGTLLAVVHVILGSCLRATPEMSGRSQRQISASLIGASILLPGGFFLGGITFYSGDPGVGGLLIPIGATLLMIAVFLIARQTSSVGLSDRTDQGASVSRQAAGPPARAASGRARSQRNEEG